MRFACLHVPDFPLAACLRARPELRDRALAVADSEGARATLLAVSSVAQRRGIVAGLTAAQARGIDSELTVHICSPSLLDGAQTALCDAAASFSPRLEDCGNGTVYLDLSGLIGSLFDSETQLASMLAQRAARLGLDAHAGVAGSKIAAFLAASQGSGVTVLPPGEEWSFLAPISVAQLSPSPDLSTTLRRWGIRTIGDLAALPAGAIGARLGPEGLLLARRARGEDDLPLVARVLPAHFEETVELDYGIDRLEALCFVLRGPLDRLTARLSVRGYLCGDLRLSLTLSGRMRDERTVRVSAPSNDIKVLLSLLRLHFEANPPSGAIEGLRVLAVPERLRAVQLDLFRPNGPAPAQIAVTLARLTALCGADRVGIPVVADSHRADAYGVERFDSDRRQTADTHSRLCTQDSQIPMLPSLRALRPAQNIEVFCHRDQPEFVRGTGFAGRVVHAAGPWRSQTDWWNEQATTRDYYDVQLSDGGVYRVYYEHQRQEWFVDGWYD